MQAKKDKYLPLPCTKEMHSLLFLHLRKEFESLNCRHIKVDIIKQGDYFNIDNNDLMDKINNKYKDHHVFIDEVGISKDKNIFLLKEVAEILAHQSKSFWISVTSFNSQDLADQLTLELQREFTIIKNELNIPLRNTLSIVGVAHNKGKSQNQCQFILKSMSFEYDFFCFALTVNSRGTLC